MSREMDPSMVANQVLHIARYAAANENELADAVISAFRRCTGGLTDYERNRVACVINFLLARVIL